MLHIIHTRKLNRRGQEMLIDFWSIVVFAMIVILFMVVFFMTKSSHSNSVTGTSVDTDTAFMLDSFLRAPAIGVDPSQSVSDIMISDYEKGNYVNTQKLFAEFYSKTDAYNGLPVSEIDLCIVKNGNMQIGISYDPNTGEIGTGSCKPPTASNAFTSFLNGVYAAAEMNAIAVPAIYFTTRSFIPDPGSGRIDVVLAVYVPANNNV